VLLHVSRVEAKNEISDTYGPLICTNMMGISQSMVLVGFDQKINHSIIETCPSNEDNI